jgi:hypothetical protein
LGSLQGHATSGVILDASHGGQGLLLVQQVLPKGC